MSGTVAPPRQGRLTPPRERMLDASGNLAVAWDAYFQALADRVALLETAARPAEPAPEPGG